MRVSSIQTIEYLKVHLAYNGIKTGVVTSLKFLEKSIGKAAEQTAALAVVLLQASLAVVAVVKVSEAWIMTSYCNDICDILPAFLTVI
ncbi:MAG: hypothetical protein R3339_06275 [Thermodesulfobacteriota bacterium]|nr:hypothetical protein [Thermodesulfobacteriota bacterium]